MSTPLISGSFSISSCSNSAYSFICKMGKSPVRAILRIGINSEKSISKTLGSTLALLKVGQSAPDVTPSTRSLVFCLARSIPMDSSNSTVMTEKSSEEVEVISTKLGTPFTASSSGSVMSRSMSSAVLPGKTVLINTLVSFISGKLSRGILK